VLAAFGIVLAVLLASYVGAEAWATRSVASHVTVLGEDLGGLPRADAKAALVRLASTVNSTPIEVGVAGYPATLMPSASGLTFDANATLDRLTGFTLNPSRLIDHLRGGGAVAPVVTVDKKALSDAVSAIASKLDRAEQSATITLDGAKVVVSGGQPGIAVKTDETVAALKGAWPSDTVVPPVATVTQPAVPRAAAEAFQATVNYNEFSDKITLTGPNGNVDLAPEDWAKFASVDVSDGTPRLVVDGEALAASLLKAHPGLNNAAHGPSVAFDSKHNLKVTEAQPGREINASSLGAHVIGAASRDDRTSVMPYTITAPAPLSNNVNVNVGDFTTKVSGFDTFLPWEPVRTKNLANAASKIKGTIIAPGGIFDLTKVISPIDSAHGYYPAGVINNGVHTLGMGGGLSQMATTSYNAAYFAGYDILDHRQHSVWFTRYPAGRESTIYSGQINMVFKNDTPYAAIMNSYIVGDRLHVDIWSTPYYRVETSATPHLNVRAPGVTVLHRPDCVPSRAGQAGFTITNYRKVFLGDKKVKDEAETWTYQPDNAIKCE
jgi:vancomycin resistance protein YoaR